MTNIRPSNAEELSKQKELWQKCFGDAMEYIDGFYANFCSPEQVLVVEEDGEVDSMAAVLPTTLRLPDGEIVPVGYIYALATNPFVQGKGHARHLLAYADQYLAGQGMKAMVLVPASPSLHKFFAALDMEECFATRKIEILGSSLSQPKGGVLTPCTPAEYNAIREEFLKDTFHMIYDDNLIAFQQFGSRFSHGDLYKVEIDGEVGCAAVEYVQNTRLLMKELLISSEKLQQAVELIAAQLPAIKYHVRTPTFWDGLQGNYVQAFAMVKWYDDELQTRSFGKDGYLGLGFD